MDPPPETNLKHIRVYLKTQNSPRLIQRLAGPSSLSPAPGLSPFTVVSTRRLGSELQPEESFVEGLAKNLQDSHLY